MVNAQENIENDESNSQADAMTDLSITNEQADRAKGGAELSSGRLLMGTEGGLWKQ
jgi:hypothetical protein